MVCIMCLVPLFLVPLINLLPRIIDFLMDARVLYSVGLKGDGFHLRKKRIELKEEEDKIWLSKEYIHDHKLYFVTAKVYAWLGWEYRKPARVPPACPFKPITKNDNATKVAAETGTEGTETIAKGVVADETSGVKQD